MVSETRKSAWRRYADAVRRVTSPGVPMPMGDPRSDEDIDAGVAAARVVLDRLLKETDAELAELQAPVSTGDDGGWKRLEEACRKLEADIRNPATLRMRLDEGRRSMMPKVERLVHSRLTPQLRQEGRKLVATVSEEGLAELRTELPAWVEGWSQYAFNWVDLDLRREMEAAWIRRDGDLPVPPPNFTPLQIPPVASNIQFPDVSINRDVTGLAGGVLRNARSIAYGALSLTFLFGVARTSISWWVYVVGFVAAVVIGGIMANDERIAERRKLEAEVRQRAEQATWDAARTWLDRMADKLAESARDQLHARRMELVTWWRRDVEPKLAEAEKNAALARARADQARLALPRLQDARRNLVTAISALDAVDALR